MQSISFDRDIYYVNESIEELLLFFFSHLPWSTCDYLKTAVYTSKITSWVDPITHIPQLRKKRRKAQC